MNDTENDNILPFPVLNSACDYPSFPHRCKHFAYPCKFNARRKLPCSVRAFIMLHSRPPPPPRNACTQSRPSGNENTSRVQHEKHNKSKEASGEEANKRLHKYDTAVRIYGVFRRGQAFQGRCFLSEGLVNLNFTPWVSCGAGWVKILNMIILHRTLIHTGGVFSRMEAVQ